MDDFANWYVEIHPTQTGLEVTRRITKHMAVRIMTGNAVIVCDRPNVTLSVIKKRWNKILRLLENERAATSSKVKKADIKDYLATLESTQFFAAEPEERQASTVWLVTPDDLDRIPNSVTSVYVASDITKSQLLYWVRQIREEGSLMLFRKDALPFAAGDGGEDEDA